VDKIVLIVAGGFGTRMKSDVPKQFRIINRKPLLMHTLEIFRRYDKDIRIILVLPEDQFITWKDMCKKYEFDVKHEIAAGGRTRFHSVQRNLQQIPDDSLVAVHDGVRPLVSLKTIERCFNTAAEFGNAVPCVAIPETLRKIDAQTTVQVDRAIYRLIQTPQVFSGSILKKAYLQDYHDCFTDDAGVVENTGYTIHLVEGNKENMKITFENDLKIAAALLNDQGS
jgi:2-C-methyl-D-erythritol 4-phosphate cytidylyltransferase